MTLPDPSPPNQLSSKEDEAEEKHSLKEHCHHFEQVFDRIKQYGNYQIFSFILIQYIM
jgi:hypothetical protein